MKNQKISRKLFLNKETISILDQKYIIGGATWLCTEGCPTNTVPYTDATYCTKC
jgi:hypothetical protein